MAVRVISVEATPNPNARKFLCNKVLVQGRASFFSAESAAGHGLGRAVFGVMGVSAVMILGDFLTVTKAADASWPEIVKGVKAAVASVE